MKFYKNASLSCGHQLECIDCRKLRNQLTWQKKIVASSKMGDKRFNRNPNVPIDEDWINDIMSRQFGRCYWCGFLMIHGDGVNRKHKDAVTIERLNNNIGHDKSNCVLACHECNERSQIVPASVMKIHAPNFKEALMKYCPGECHENDMDRACLIDDFSKKTSALHGITTLCRKCDSVRNRKRHPTNYCRYCGDVCSKRVCKAIDCLKKKKSDECKRYYQRKKQKLNSSA
jgi:hypothetical protein